MKRFQVEKEYKGYDVIQYLKEVKGYSSRGIKNAEIYVNNKKVKGAKKLRYLQVVKVVEKEKEVNIPPVKMDLNIVHEDKELLILNKQPFLIVHPTLKKDAVSLASGIIYYYKEKGIDFVPRFYNRLDMNTSGLIVIAKSGYAQAFLQNQGEVKKEYIAVVKGIVEKDEFFIEKKIGLSEDGIKREISDDGQEAKTHVKVLKRDTQKGITLVELELFTGRTHQIRVHMSSIGHPVVGDHLYGGLDPMADRQLLHSWKLELIHPETKEVVRYTAEIPADIKSVIEI